MCKSIPHLAHTLTVICLLAGSPYACSDDEEPTETSDLCFEPTLDVALCDPQTATFSLDSTNPYYPLVVGSVVVLEGTEDDELIRVERTVLDETEVVAGVTTRVLEHREYVDGEIYEIARNFYVEATDGTVCYFGEDVEFYEGGDLVNEDGSWRAGEAGAEPGIIMPADPEVGDAYLQENAPGLALDQGRVTAIGQTQEINGTSYDDVVTISDSNPIDDEDPCEEELKVYVPNIGEVEDAGKVLISFTPGAT